MGTAKVEREREKSDGEEEKRLEEKLMKNERRTKKSLEKETIRKMKKKDKCSAILGKREYILC